MTGKRNKETHFTLAICFVYCSNSVYVDNMWLFLSSRWFLIEIESFVFFSNWYSNRYFFHSFFEIKYQ